MLQLLVFFLLLLLEVVLNAMLFNALQWLYSNLIFDFCIIAYIQDKLISELVGLSDHRKLHIRFILCLRWHIIIPHAMSAVFQNVILSTVYFIIVFRKTIQFVLYPTCLLITITIKYVIYCHRHERGQLYDYLRWHMYHREWFHDWETLCCNGKFGSLDLYWITSDRLDLRIWIHVWSILIKT